MAQLASLASAAFLLMLSLHLGVTVVTDRSKLEACKSNLAWSVIPVGADNNNCNAEVIHSALSMLYVASQAPDVLYFPEACTHAFAGSQPS